MMFDNKFVLSKNVIYALAKNRYRFLVRDIGKINKILSHKICCVSVLCSEIYVFPNVEGVSMMSIWMNMTKKLGAVLALIMLAFWGSVSYGAELVDPKPVNVPEGMKTEVLVKAIKGAINEQKWVLSGEKDNWFEVSLFVRTHKVMMKINYSSSQVSFHYKDSENLKYKERKGKQFIHKKYMEWSQRLADRVAMNIQMGESYTPSAKPIPLNVAPNGPSNPPPKEPFSNFGAYVIEGTTLEKAYQNKAQNNDTARNLTHNLNLRAEPKLKELFDSSKSSRTLVIKPHITKVKFIGAGARFMVGRMAGRSWITVKLTLIDKDSGEVIAEPFLHRVAQAANGYTLARNDYAMVEDMAVDIYRYIDRNFHTAVGGGNYPEDKYK